MLRCLCAAAFCAEQMGKMRHCSSGMLPGQTVADRGTGKLRACMFGCVCCRCSARHWSEGREKAVLYAPAAPHGSFLRRNAQRTEKKRFLRSGGSARQRFCAEQVGERGKMQACASVFLFGCGRSGNDAFFDRSGCAEQTSEVPSGPRDTAECRGARFFLFLAAGARIFLRRPWKREPDGCLDGDALRNASDIRRPFPGVRQRARLPLRVGV